MASHQMRIFMTKCHVSRWKSFLNAGFGHCHIRRITGCINQCAPKESKLENLTPGYTPQRNHWTRTPRTVIQRSAVRGQTSSAHSLADISAKNGLFHIDIPVQPSNGQPSGREAQHIRQPKIPGSKEVSYNYNKTMLTASAYLLRERAKLIAEPRTELESFHSKHTPRLFYLEREEYKHMASCLPRNDSELVTTCDSLSGEEFLDRIGTDKNSYFPVPYFIDGIQSLAQRSDEALISLNNDARFLRLCTIIRVICPKMSHEELVLVLMFLARVQVRTRVEALPALYEECRKRTESSTLRQQLLLVDAWRMIGLPVPRFSSEVFARCERHVPAMNTPELVQLIYLIGENRGAPKNVEKKSVHMLSDHFSSMTLTEVGAVCTGLFKSNTSPSTEDLMMQISDLVCSSDIQTVHSFFVVGILKHFRRQYYGYQHFFQYVANAVTPLLKWYPVMSCMQILLTYATMHICHAQLCNEIAEQIIQKADQWRSKDTTKVLWSYGTLQFLPESPQFLPTVLGQHLRLHDDMQEYPMNLVSSLLSLAYLQLFPWELIDRLYSKEFMDTVIDYMDKSGVDLRRDLLLLDRSLEIECPEYDGNRLDESLLLRSDISSEIVPSIGQQLTNRSEVRFIAGLVRAAVGTKEHYRIHSILPHFNTLDIEVRLDEKNRPIVFNTPSLRFGGNSKEDLSQFPNARTKANGQKGKNAVSLSSNLIADLTQQGTVQCAAAPRSMNIVQGTNPKELGAGGAKNGQRDGLRKGYLTNIERILQKPVAAPTPSGEKWLAIVVWARNHSHYGGSKLLGQHAMKRRQLELLGYHVIDVSFREWSTLFKSRDQLSNVKFMRNKIFNNSSKL
ncbi:FAST kinase domain-containing protein 5, mitochondrial-like [Diadema setosum]|uniref:FAST kinase domain-containing protein 5, mitochondrial-like n=1 Tax=Diadema setosum TaxID=31175 RepID=UPI003B3BA0B8